MLRNLDLRIIEYAARRVLTCSGCGYELESRSIDSLVRRANENGWRYDYQEDGIYCSDCLVIIKEGG
ncbi:MAG: hypothetical protein DDT23_00039 [candidate division WS2 bacterium]|nr:hypothetical protein [Candidatus Lithacetigena glycinireducens]